MNEDYKLAFCQATNRLPTDIQIKIWEHMFNNKHIQRWKSRPKHWIYKFGV